MHASRLLRQTQEVAAKVYGAPAYADVCCRMLPYADVCGEQTQEVAAKVYATAEHPIVARVLVMLAKIQVHLAV